MYQEQQIIQLGIKCDIYGNFGARICVRKSRRMRLDGTVSSTVNRRVCEAHRFYPLLLNCFLWGVGITRLVHRVLVGKPDGKRPLRRPRRRWEDNIKMDLQEMEGGCGDWMELAQDRDRWRALVSTVMNLRVS